MKGTVYRIPMSDGTEGFLVDGINKNFRSKNYNFSFRKSDGYFERWGGTKEEDSDLNLGQMEILDFEISEVCHGPRAENGIETPCSFCYKRNTKNGKNTSIETFKKIFEKLPKTLTQVAFGIGDIDGNSDMKDIFEHCKSNGVTPNVTINGSRMTSEWFDFIAETCGACAVSVYNKDDSYNAIEELTNRGMTQVNIHAFLSVETLDRVRGIIADVKCDPRLSKLNAIVLLSLKSKGRALDNGFTPVPQDIFDELIDELITNDISFGFDSCSAGKVTKWSIARNRYDDFKEMIEPCESSIFSGYFNVDGHYFPCSFMEGEPGWETGLDVVNCDDFLKDVWQHPRTKAFREKTISCRENCQGCTHYKI